MNQAEPIPAPEETARPARHARVGDIHVLRLSGSFYEMGKQHGEMLRDVIPRGPLPYYRTYVERLLGKSFLGPVGPLVWPAFMRAVKKRVFRNVPSFALETLEGMAEGSETPLEEMLSGASMPDALLWLVARINQVAGHGPAVRHRVALGLGCTSAIAWGDATADGALLHARNFDYHGVECWPRTKALLFHEPDDGMRYASVTAAGVPMGGVTAMNEAGLTLTVHQHMFTDVARLAGTPIGIAGDEVMRNARDLDEAEAILGRYRPNGGWTYLIADGHAKELLCWEESPDRQVSRRVGPEETTFGYANVYLDPELGSREVSLYESYWRHNMSRHRTANRLLEEGAGRLDPDAMAAILGWDGGPRERISSSIAMLMTVGSVVFRPEDGVLWMATGETPTSQRPFLPFSLARQGHAPEHGRLTGGMPGDAREEDAFEHYRRAYVACVDRGDLPAARREMDQARAIAGGEPLYHVLAGLMAVRQLDTDGAIEAFDRALEIGHPHEQRIASFLLWRGRAHDLAGRRDRALADYRRALGHPIDPPVFKAARRGLRRPYAAQRAQNLAIDFVYADVVAP